MGGGSVESTEANLPISEYMLIVPVNLKPLAGDPRYKVYQSTKL
jgi:hypothetical protein